MKSKRLIAAVAIALSSLSGGALAANISNINGQACPAGFTGTWHFVNNQTGGAAPGQLIATWSSGDSCTVSASKVNASNQHFYCTATGTLSSASTNLPGRLVLSDFSCQDTKCEKDCEPPK